MKFFIAKIIVGLLILIIGHNLLSRITDWGFLTKAIVLISIGAFVLMLMEAFFYSSDKSLSKEIKCPNCKFDLELNEKEIKIGRFRCPECGKTTSIKK